MKHAFRAWLAVFIFAAAGGAAACAGEGAENASPYRMQTASALAAQLDAQVRGIAASPLMSHAKKEKRISTAVRIAIVAATAYDDDSGEVLDITIELASAAARAAPAYTEAIAKAAAFSPTVARIGGASGQIRAAAVAAARAPRRPAAEIAQNSAPLAPPPFSPSPFAASGENPPMEEPAVPNPAAGPNPPVVAEAGTELPPPGDSAPLETPPVPEKSPSAPNQNASVHATLDTSVQRNDNVFLTENKTADTLVSTTPGVEAGFGQNSLAHGALVLQESLTHYVDHSSPDAHLANVLGNLGYADDSLRASALGSYQQLDQNNADFLSLGQPGMLLRTNVSNLGGGVESQLLSKMSVKAGAAYSDTDYESPGLVGNRTLSLPASLYFNLAPKLDLSTGFTYGTTVPTGAGPDSKDYYYNIGARGTFTPKLTGDFSAGYHERQVDFTPRETLWGFSGAFNYQATEKTAATLSLSRNFDASALGQSTKNTQYSLQIKSDLTDQFSLTAIGTYRLVDYGPTVFIASTASSPSVGREDKYWESSLLASYTFTSWLSTVASYTFRDNGSTLAGVDFNNNVFSLSLDLRY